MVCRAAFSGPKSRSGFRCRITTLRSVSRASFINLRLRSNSSPANHSSLNPPTRWNASASTKMNEPAISFVQRLIPFQIPDATLPLNDFSSILSVEPPASVRPETICSATLANKPSHGRESASTNTNQSPVATAAPTLRARAIWLTGSKHHGRPCGPGDIRRAVSRVVVADNQLHLPASQRKGM